MMNPLVSEDDPSSPRRQRQKQQQKERRKRRRDNKSSASSSSPSLSGESSILSSRPFQFLLLGLGATFLVSTELFLMLDWHHENEIEMLMLWHIKTKSIPPIQQDNENNNNNGQSSSSSYRRHLIPQLPYWPPFPLIENSQQLIEQTLGSGHGHDGHENHQKQVQQQQQQQQPTVAGIAAVLYQFLDEFHTSNQHLSSLDKEVATDSVVRGAYYSLATKHLVALDNALFEYGSGIGGGGGGVDSNSNNKDRHRKLHFDVREDDSIFISVAAYREHLLVDTLRSIYENAVYPEKVFVGVIVNNCFGDSASNVEAATGSSQYQNYKYNDPSQQTCTGGVYVSGHNKMGQDILDKLPDGTPDPNGIDQFCSNTTFTKYCHDGQVRVLYVDEIEALGPTVARYYSSKLWGGETYYMQIDAHLRFATSWDVLYVEELHATRSYPKSLLSQYPPGFVNFRQNPPFIRGNKLCRCQLRSAEGWLPRVEMQGRYSENATRPTQMPFMGAGFFFVHAQFLADVPFDPFLPWMFMGEEVALSVRAWTSGYNIYAPRINLIGHQYRPISMGNPHYQDTINKLYKNRPGLMGKLQKHVSKRIKYLLGYYNDPDNKIPGFDKQKKDGIPDEVLTEIDRDHSASDDEGGNGLYGVGTERTVKEYLKFAEVDLHEVKCGPLKWCIDGTVE
mmetsp:Transcript_32964/g.80132  ORF Transcript_32964/g.80132 Transcript_32964/m.80132 type:complete len:675 (+) Transcript_32964:88-2112(+)